MNYNTTTRVPVNDEYTGLVGKAVYIFAYYERAIIWIIEKISLVFVEFYSRGKPMTSGTVLKNLRRTVASMKSLPEGVTREDLIKIIEKNSALIIKRNALIHAHPCTDNDGSQILSYQTNTPQPLPKMKWPVSEVESLIYEIDRTACETASLLEKLG
ncbi:hypothetical protein [Pantoea dispersa]|uniref:hypothetical protein n=1 Tax=Pantoea dispersa TaxID=59814 RepID=UPI001F51B26E|nr:hypothetical protein [Pantoea dispersa]MCI1030515.1 hypothetical protein [Pantoea dispersa]